MRNSPSSSRLSVDVTHSGEPSTKKMRFLRGAVPEDERAGLAPDGEVEEARRQARRIEPPAVDGVGRELGVPLERRARDEARELGVLGGRLGSARSRARSSTLEPTSPVAKSSMRRGKGIGPSDRPVLALHAVDAGRDVARSARGGRARRRRPPRAGRAACVVSHSMRRRRTTRPSVVSLLDVAGRAGHEPELLDAARRAATGPTWSRRRRTISSRASANAAARRPAQGGIARERAEEHGAHVVGHAPAGAVDGRRGRRRGCAGGRRAPCRR